MEENNKELPEWVKEHLELREKLRETRMYVEVNEPEELFPVLWGIVEKVCENMPGERRR